MARDFPDDWRALRELHLLLLQIGREDDATEPLQEAVQRDPTNIELTLGLAAHLLARQRSAEAEQMYRRAVALDPHNTTAYLGIATTFDLMNRLGYLARLVEEAESAGISAAGLSFIRAYDHHRSKRYKQGLEELLQVPEDLETARRQQLLGQLLQANGDYDGAFAAFERMNALMREDPSQPDERGAIFRNIIREQLRSLTPEWVNSWSKTEIDERDSPVFLVGFPRSGTTLLDTILMSHPSVEVLEEEPMLARAAGALGGFAAIASASPDQLAEARNVYFESARSLTPLKPGNLLIDKNPLSMNNLPMIRRLFPDAKIILALRHPCDVVLSCFVTNFKLNNGMASFLKLETAAELYDLSFSYFERACQLLAPPVHKILYENVVADLDRELRPLLEFLELPWDERVLDHQSTARSRGHIKTASYSQVVEPIYTRSSGRWRNYRSHLEPIFPVLKPWIDKFGYEL
jgi:tetratricopeptide (TPR) repeat protein